MSEAIHVQFDDPPRGAGADETPATERIAATLQSAGIDAPNSLYDEALAYARDGHLGQAQARLQMLLCLDPDDADALLLLAKVHLAQCKPADALARLDAAAAAGGIPPAGFREHVEAAIRAERAREEEHRTRVAAREQGEIRSLRNETRTLRSEQVRLETEITETRLRERNWKYTALGTSVLATIVILLLVFTGGRTAPSEVEITTAASELPTETVGASTAGAAGASVAGAPTAVDVQPPKAERTEAEKKVALQALAGKPSPEAKKVEAALKPDGKPDKAGAVHVVESGDTLEKLAARYYGDKTRWQQIQAANPKVLKGGIALSIGMKLRIP